MRPVRVLLAVGLASASVLTGCATLPPTSRGTVIMKVNDAKAHVRLDGDNMVAVGDDVMLSRRRCSVPSAVDGARQCWMEPVGRAEVTQVLNVHDVVVRVASGVAFAEGDRVEAYLPPRSSLRPEKR